MPRVPDGRGGGAVQLTAVLHGVVPVLRQFRSSDRGRAREADTGGVDEGEGGGFWEGAVICQEFCQTCPTARLFFLAGAGGAGSERAIPAEQSDTGQSNVAAVSEPAATKTEK